MRKRAGGGVLVSYALWFAAAGGCGGRVSADAGGGGSDAASDGGGATDAGAPAPVSGTITERGSVPTAPIGGAAVSIVDALPANTTTTAADGTYTLLVAPGTTVYVRAEAAGVATAQKGLVVPTGGATVDLALVPQVAVNAVAAQLGITIDPARGEMIVEFATSSTAGGLGATLSAVHDPSFAFDAAGTATTTDTTLPNGEQALFYPNVTAGTTTVLLAAPAGTACAPRNPLPEWRVDPLVFTDVDADCL
ncbi:MAG TPA: carboxypeptidase-like regulatory domain-containing protein [Myxococcota bacterium]|jgi:hypothetical protein|nr:carboxypeptidase-like regulatory domain-containing protein [Myxococcota bacterium]